MGDGAGKEGRDLEIQSDAMHLISPATRQNRRNRF